MYIKHCDDVPCRTACPLQHINTLSSRHSFRYGRDHVWKNENNIYIEKEFCCGELSRHHMEKSRQGSGRFQSLATFCGCQWLQELSWRCPDSHICGTLRSVLHSLLLPLPFPLPFPFSLPFSSPSHQSTNPSALQYL